MNERLTIPRPDDWHVHLRDEALLAAVLGDTARHFARAIVMPNLKPPVRSLADAIAYRDRIRAALPEDSGFEPLMTLYLTDSLPPDEIARAKVSGAIHAAKLYPAGATTNAEQGVTRLERIYPVLEAMQDCELPLLVHGELADRQVDLFDRERCFIDEVLTPLVRDFPGLRLVLEHITTAEAVEFVQAAPANLAATITPHHLLYNRNAMLAGGIRPHFYCLPVLKRERHRRALVAAATSGSPKFFLGTDSAPHPLQRKEASCGCAGIFSAHAAIELYAEAFEEAGALARLEAFASRNGADFYRLPRNRGRIRLRRERWKVPETYPFGGSRLVPLRAGEEVAWRLAA